MSDAFPNTIEGRQALRDLQIPEQPELKKCEGTCGMFCELDRAGEFFDADEKNKDGFKKVCKACRSEQRLLQKMAERNRQLETIDQRIVGLLNQARPGGSEVAHIAEIYAKIAALMGGPNGLAMAAVQTYVQADPGSPTRQKMIGQFLQLANNVTQSGAAKVPLELLSEEELEAEIIRRDRLRGVVSQATPPRIHEPDDDSDLKDSTEDDGH